MSQFYTATKRRPNGAAFIIAAILAALGALLIWQGFAIPDKGGYAGIIKSLKGVNWSDDHAVQFWITPDGKGQKLIIQLNSNGEDFEVDLTDLAKKTEPQLVTLPFSQFKGKNGGMFDKSAVQHFAIYCNSIGDAPVDSHIYFDDIQAVK